MDRRASFQPVWDLPVPHSILSYIAGQTKKIRLGTGVSVLPFHNPIRLAEESAMVDVLSNGRLDFGVGRGSADYEYGNFDIDFESRDQRFQEVLDIILGLWTTTGFTCHGEFYKVEDLTLAPLPLQKPHPPVFLAVSRTAASVDVAVVSNQQKWDTLGAERSWAGWRSGELPEGPVVASSPFGGLSLHLLPAL